MSCTPRLTLMICSCQRQLEKGTSVFCVSVQEFRIIGFILQWNLKDEKYLPTESVMKTML